MKEIFLLKLGEIVLKGANKRQFEDKLRQNVRRRVKEYGEFDANKHTLVQKDAKAPTCTEIGWDAYESCTECDYTTYEVLPAITHTDANCDYKCDYNCGYVYETLDFSDAKVLTEENGILYIDGEKAEDDGVTFLLHAGKYKLAENISASYIWVAGEVALDLNGYVWDLEDSYIAVNAPFSVYDTSAEEKGKITSTAYCTITTNSEYGVFSLYSGTIENNSTYEDRMAISSSWASANLYGGKVKGNGYALSASSDYNIGQQAIFSNHQNIFPLRQLDIHVLTFNVLHFSHSDIFKRG